MRPIIAWILTLAAATAGVVEDFIKTAGEKHGEEGKRAAEFLTKHMPEADKSQLSLEFLMENLDLAMKAREEFPWAKSLSEELFLNEVLPYAVFDEPRDPWRKDFYEKGKDLVKDAKSASEAVQLLNREFFKLINVHYHTGRKRPNQSPKESMESGMATCSGLSIILVDVCRAVGVPARAVGTPMWSNGRGNHTWVEIWDGGWKFTGADEYDEKGLDRGWFVKDAAEAKAEVKMNAIYATSWKRDGGHFPLVWAPGNDSVGAENVTARYVKSSEKKDGSRLGVRVFEKQGGERVVAKVVILERRGVRSLEQETKAGRSDLNDMPRFELREGAEGWLRVSYAGGVRELAFGPLGKGDVTMDVVWDELTHAAVDQGEMAKRGLSKAEAERVLLDLAEQRKEEVAKAMASVIESKVIEWEGKKMRWLEKRFGEAPEGKRSLWISMHGGGGAPPQVNDQQWQNQIRLYQPKEGFYVAPRAPTDTWNLWHEGHIDPMFQIMIDAYVAVGGVDPERVYLMGYSAGGDGVWQLAPRMADRWAAAAMMAGHPNEAKLDSLRNLPFAIFMGALDGAYQRNQIAKDRTAELDRLRKEDPLGYEHFSRIYEGLGHWMELKDAEGVPWMEKFRRQTWPKRVVWLQDDVIHHRFYWIALPRDAKVEAGDRMVAEVKGQTIEMSGKVPAGTVLRLSDELLDLDQPVVVTVQGKKVFEAKVPRKVEVMKASLAERLDVSAAATAELKLP